MHSNDDRVRCSVAFVLDCSRLCRRATPEAVMHRGMLTPRHCSALNRRTVGYRVGTYRAEVLAMVPTRRSHTQASHNELLLIDWSLVPFLSMRVLLFGVDACVSILSTALVMRAHTWRPE